jgi:hypothetical protein
VHEQPTNRSAELRIKDRAVNLPAADRNHLLYRGRGLGMDRDDALFPRFTCSQADSVRTVGVGVQTVEMQLADLGASGSAPTGDQQRTPLQRAFQRTDTFHQRFKFVLGM